MNMFYENVHSCYLPCEEHELLRRMEPFSRHRAPSNTFYPSAKRKGLAGSLLFDASTKSSLVSSSSSSPYFPLSTKKANPKKISPTNIDALSFCHTIYITINKDGPNPSCSSFLDYSHASPADSQLLLLPDICCTIPASKLSSQRWLVLNITVVDIVSRPNLPSYSISSHKHRSARLRHRCSA